MSDRKYHITNQIQSDFMRISVSSVCLTMNQALTQVEETKGNQLFLVGHKELSVIYGPLGRYKSIFTQMIQSI